MGFVTLMAKSLMENVGRSDIVLLVIPVKPRSMDRCFEINPERKSFKVKPLHCGIQPLMHCKHPCNCKGVYSQITSGGKIF